MDDLPPAMLGKGKSPDPVFEDREDLYRAFAPEALDGTSLELDAIELPDMSVNRGKYGPPDWLLLLEAFRGWGVASFLVGDIPKEMMHLGVLLYTFKPIHLPLQHPIPKCGRTIRPAPTSTRK